MFKPTKKITRVTFSQGIPTTIYDLDGDAVCRCKLIDISPTGALLVIEEGLSKRVLSEFFITLTANNSVVRRCERAWLDERRVGATFVRNVESDFAVLIQSYLMPASYVLDA